MAKRPLGCDVLNAATSRIHRIFDDFPRIYVAFSGGKDSAVMLHLVMREARRRYRKVGVLFIDLEAQYKLTIDYVAEMFETYRCWIEPYWVALPLRLRNAVSQFEPQWICWEPGRECDWVRQPFHGSIISEDFFLFFRRGMEFEEFTPAFGQWYAQEKLCACFIGIRSSESLNRYLTIADKKKAAFEGLQWTTQAGEMLYNAYPLYDWRTEDIRAALHELSPMRREPVDFVRWVKAEHVYANDYNPNNVAPPEMRLLQLSIMTDGYTQPIVAWPGKPNRYEVVDGFHRNRIGREADVIKKRVRGRLPVSIINPERTNREERIAATVRHNRARGRHEVDAMADIVQDLARCNWNDGKIARELGMEPDEVLRLKQIVGLAEMFADKAFSEAWEAE